MSLYRPQDVSNPEEVREEWENETGHGHREGWEVDAGIQLLEAGEIEVEGRLLDVEKLDPQIGFVDVVLSYADERYVAEMHYYPNTGYSIELQTDEVRMPMEGAENWMPYAEE